MNPDNIRDLFDSTKKEFQKLLTIKNLDRLYDNTLFNDFLTKQIMGLLTKGIYCKSFNFPGNLKDLIFQVINRPDKMNLNNFVEALKQSWEIKSTNLYIQEIVKELSLKYIIDHNINIDKQNVNKIVRSFFINIDEQAIGKISGMILNQEGV